MAKNIEDLIAPNAIPYQGVAFNPLEYKPFTPDVNILQRSLAQIEERNEKASTHKAALKKALGEARLKVNQDEDSLRFFDEFAQQLEEPILAASERGDAAAAIEAAQQSAGDLTNDPAYLGLIQNTARYQEALKTVRDRANKGDISDEVREYWEHTNKFNANWVRDNSGKIIGSEEWKSNWIPVSQGDIDAMFAGIAKSITPNKQGPSNGYSDIDEETGSIVHISSSGIKEWLSEPEIAKEFETSLANNDTYRNMVLQNLRAQVHYVETHSDDPDPKVQEKINHIQETYMIGENSMSDNEYIKQVCKDYARRYAYNYNLIHTDETKTKPRSGNGDDYEGQGITPYTGQTTGGTAVVLQSPGNYSVNVR